MDLVLTRERDGGGPKSQKFSRRHVYRAWLKGDPQVW